MPTHSLPVPPPARFTASPVGGSAVAVLGAGWLGLPLARALAAGGRTVRVSTTSPAKLPGLVASGLAAHVLALEPDSAPAGWPEFLGGADALVISIPPGLRGVPDPGAAATRYAARLTRLGALLTDTPVRRVVLLSSTAVYPDRPGAPELPEEAADPAHPLVQAEAALAGALPAGVALTVARLGGLMGPGRAPGRFFKPGQVLPQPAAPVNMLHLTDAVGAVRALVEHPTAAGPFAVCAAGHPTRAVFYAAAARLLGWSLGQATPEGRAGAFPEGKRVSSARLRALTGYRFQYDDPVAALIAC